VRGDIIRVALGVVAILAQTACDTISCPPSAETRSTIVWDRTTTQKGQLRGVAVSLGDGHPITTAQTRFTPVDSTWRMTRAGEFRYARARTANANLEVRAPGFASAFSALSLPTDSGTVVVAVLAKSLSSRVVGCVNTAVDSSSRTSSRIHDDASRRLASSSVLP
jgi:hypothetical protein